MLICLPLQLTVQLLELVLKKQRKQLARQERERKMRDLRGGREWDSDQAHLPG